MNRWLGVVLLSCAVVTLPFAQASENSDEIAIRIREMLRARDPRFLGQIAAFGVEALPALRGVLKNGDSDSKKLAIETVMRIHELRSLDLLLLAMQDQDPGVRTLGAVGFRAEFGTQFSVRSDSYHREREHQTSNEYREAKLAYDELLSYYRYIEMGRYFERVIADGLNPDFKVRRALIEYLLKEIDASDAPPKDENAVRGFHCGAYDHSPEYALSFAVENNVELCEAMIRDASVQGRTQLLATLPASSPNYLDLAQSFARSENATFRMVAASCFGKLNSSEAMKQLLILARDKAALVRFDALLSLGDRETLSTEAIQCVRSMMDDPKPTISAEASDIYAKVGGKESKNYFLGRLKDKDPEVRVEAIRLLSRTEDASLFDILAGSLKDTDPSVRFAAISAVANIDAIRAPKKLIPMLRDEDVDVVSNAVWSLKELNCKEALPALRALLSSSDEDLLRYVREAIEGITGVPPPILAGTLDPRP